MRSAILGIVAYSAWDSIPEEYRGYAVLGVCLILIGCINQVTNTIKSAWTVSRFTSKVVGTIVAIPVRFVHYICTANAKIKSLHKKIIALDEEKNLFKTEAKTQRELSDAISNTLLTIKGELGIYENDKLIRAIKKEKKHTKETEMLKRNANHEAELRKHIIQALDLQPPRTDGEIFGVINDLNKRNKEQRDTLALVREALKCNPNEDIIKVARDTKNIADASNIAQVIDFNTTYGNNNLTKTYNDLSKFLDLKKEKEKFKIIKEEIPKFKENTFINTPIEYLAKRKIVHNIFEKSIKTECALEIIIDDTGSMEQYKERINTEIVKLVTNMQIGTAVKITAENDKIAIWINRNESSYIVNGCSIEASRIEEEIRRQLKLISYQYNTDPFNNTQHINYSKDIIIITDTEVCVSQDTEIISKKKFENYNVNVICLTKYSPKNNGLNRLPFPIHHYIIKDEEKETEIQDTTIVLDLSKESLEEVDKLVFATRIEKLIQNANNKKTKLNLIITGSGDDYDTVRFYFDKEQETTDTNARKLLNYVKNIITYNNINAYNLKESIIIKGIKKAIYLEAKHITLMNKIPDRIKNEFDNVIAEKAITITYV